MLKLGVVGTSRKKNERRLPIHPDHFARLPESLRSQLVFEEGYGASLGITDDEIARQTGGIATRHELLADLGAVILLKPEVEDLEVLREGGLVWGWPHCTQQRDLTQVAIDRRHTLIAFEDMFVWGPDGHIGRHTFYKNNELAGYSGVLHALQLKGIDGHYGNQRKAVIIGFGAVSRGAIQALKTRGYRDITVCIRHPDYAVHDEVLDCHYVRMRPSTEGDGRQVVVESNGSERPFLDLIGEADIIVNAIFQNPDKPLMFVTDHEISRLKQGSLIVDISCDEGMGFSFAKPTTFDDPMFKVGPIDYYGVDHTPSYLWESATRVISEALLPHLPTVLAGREAWRDDETIRRAVVIDEGVIQNPDILSFQGRQPQYPHEPLAVALR